jgi:hypothetical protein
VICLHQWIVCKVLVRTEPVLGALLARLVAHAAAAYFVYYYINHVKSIPVDALDHSFRLRCNYCISGASLRCTGICLATRIPGNPQRKAFRGPCSKPEGASRSVRGADLCIHTGKPLYRVFRLLPVFTLLHIMYMGVCLMDTRKNRVE